MLRELLTKPTSWILALAILVLVAQNSGLLGRATDVFGGQPQSQQQQTDQHQELGRKVDETNKKLDTLTDQLRANGNSAATGFRILCLQNARTQEAQQQCARIQ